MQLPTGGPDVPTANALVTTAMQLLRKSGSVLPCNRIGIATTDFFPLTPNTSSISGLFGRGRAKKAVSCYSAYCKRKLCISIQISMSSNGSSADPRMLLRRCLLRMHVCMGFVLQAAHILPCFLQTLGTQYTRRRLLNCHLCLSVEFLIVKAHRFRLQCRLVRWIPHNLVSLARHLQAMLFAKIQTQLWHAVMLECEL
jgi:hypothetical protein